MIEASIAAVPGLIVSFLMLAVVLAAPTALVAKARNKPWPLRTALAVHVAGILAVTLLPGDAGLEPWQCDTGAPTHLLTSPSSLLNIALFAPAAFLAVQLFRRPATVAAAGGCVSAMVELAQSVAGSGRSCSVSDLAANTTGALVGALAGAVWLHRRRRPPHRPVRDLVRGAGLAVIGAVGVTGIFDSHITPVDVVAQDDRTRSLAESSIHANEWITTAAKGIYGSGTEVTETATQKSGDRLKITAETNRGTISGWWPDKNLVSHQYPDLEPHGTEAPLCHHGVKGSVSQLDRGPRIDRRQPRRITSCRGRQMPCVSTLRRRWCSEGARGYSRAP